MVVMESRAIINFYSFILSSVSLSLYFDNIAFEFGNVRIFLVTRLFIAHQSEERLSNKNKLNSYSDVHPYALFALF